jgi:uncharacterized repeat protein (TIGR01451 family)
MTAAASAGLLMTLLTGCNPTQPWRSELLSPNAAGTDGGNRDSTVPVFSPDGTKVAYESAASDLGPTDTNGVWDIYVRDLTTGTTTLVSTDAAGTDSGNLDSWWPVFSPDSTSVAFMSIATDLVPGVVDDNGLADVYVRDLTTGTTTLVSANAGGTATAESHSGQPVFGPDGTEVAFVSHAGDLGPTDTNDNNDVYVRDLATGSTTLVSVDASGTTGGQGLWPAFSPDGTRIAFLSEGSGFGSTDTNGRPDVYVRDRRAGTTTLVSANAAGDDSGDAGSNSPVFGPDGVSLAFDSEANDLVANDPHAGGDVFVRDLTTGTTTLVSPRAPGAGGGNGYSSRPAFSRSGERIVFHSTAPDLVLHDTNDDYDVFVRDLASGVTTLVSANADGTDSGNGSSSGGLFGRSDDEVVFPSGASDLGPAARNRIGGVYVRDLRSGVTTLVSANASGSGNGNGSSGSPTVSPAGNGIAFASTASDLGPADPNGSGDIYLATYHAADLGLALAASPEPVGSGGQLTYELAVTNGGPDTADDTTLGLLLPEGVTFDGATAGSGTCAAPPPVQPRLVTCAIGDVADGDTVEVTVTADVTAATGSSLTALASVRSGTADVSSDDNTVAATSTVG